MRTSALLVLAGLLGTGLHAQDALPFFAGRAPLLLDPSRTGFDPGGQLTLMHQDQWLQVPGAWRNEQLAIGWNLRNTKKEVDSWLGLGAVAMQQQGGAANGRLSGMGALAAMHLRAGRRSYLSAGLEVRWNNGRLGEGGAWGSQYDGLRHDPALASGEDWASSQRAWAEARAGISFTLKQAEESPRRRERDLLVAGLSAGHLGHLVLKESGRYTTPAPLLLTAYVRGEMPIEPWPNGFLAAEITGHVGGAFATGRLDLYAGKHLYNRTRAPGGPALVGFKAGLGCRLHDALIANAALDLGQYTFGLAYGWAAFLPEARAAGRRSVELLVQARIGGGPG